MLSCLGNDFAAGLGNPCDKLSAPWSNPLVTHRRTMAGNYYELYMFFFLPFRYNIVFMNLTYTIPLVSLTVTYGVIAHELWGSNQLITPAYRHETVLKSKKKVRICIITFAFRMLGLLDMTEFWFCILGDQDVHCDGVDVCSMLVTVPHLLHL